MGAFFKILTSSFTYAPLAWEGLKVIFSTIRRVKHMGEETNAGGVDLDKLADSVLADLASIKTELAGFKGPIADVVKNIPDVVAAVEKVGVDLKLAGEQKRDLAVKIINRLVDIPLVPESVEAILIGFVVDAVVAAYNKYGKDWLGGLKI